MMNDLLHILFKNEQGEMQVRLEDPLAQDLPAWPGQWTLEEIDVVASSALTEEMTEMMQMDSGKILGMLRYGTYAVLQPLKGIGAGLDRELVLMGNRRTGLFFTLVINKGWRDDGRPQLGVINARPLDLAFERRDGLLKRIELARKVMAPWRFAQWESELRSTIPVNALEWLLHKRDKALIEARDAQGHTLPLGILPHVFVTQPCSTFLKSDAFWAWLDARIQDAREYESRVNGQDVETFCLEDLVSLRLHTKREPAQYDFTLWSRT